MKTASIAIATLAAIALTACGGGGPAPMIASAPAIIAAPAPEDESAKEESPEAATLIAEDRPTSPKRPAPAPVVQASAPPPVVEPAPAPETDWLEMAGTWGFGGTNIRAVWNADIDHFAITETNWGWSQGYIPAPPADLTYNGRIHARRAADTATSWGAVTIEYDVDASTLAYDVNFDPQVDGHLNPGAPIPDRDVVGGWTWSWDDANGKGGFLGTRLEGIAGTLAYDNSAGEEVRAVYGADRLGTIAPFTLGAPPADGHPPPDDFDW